MPRIRHRMSAAATAGLLLLLSGCDRLRSTEPPPSFQSPTVGVAQEISAGPATPAATPASNPAAAK